MPLIRPFAGLRPASGKESQVAAPPYDVLNTEEARQRVIGRPWSFLHISRPEIDLPLGTNQFSPEVYNKAKENFDCMLDEGILKQDSSASYYIYRLTMGSHQQTGIMAVASVSDYDNNKIRKHEFTRPDKEDDRVRQIEALNAQTGPVFITYRQNQSIDDIVTEIAQAEPQIDITADDGVQHTLWVVTDKSKINKISEHFNAMDAIYIADGHHRSAAASRVASARRKNNQQHTGEENYNYFLSVIFPDKQMLILDYNRVVKDLNGLSVTEFITDVEKSFTVEKVSMPYKPDVRGEFGMYIEGIWYKLTIKTQLVPKEDPVARLDVSLLANNLIAPILNITDPRRDKRIDFVGGIRGLDGLSERIDSGEMKVGFSLFPTSLADLMAVADAGKVMPPKSTWFEPKLADGLVSHMLT